MYRSLFDSLEIQYSIRTVNNGYKSCVVMRFSPRPAPRARAGGDEETDGCRRDGRRRTDDGRTDGRRMDGWTNGRTNGRTVRDGRCVTSARGAEDAGRDAVMKRRGDARWCARAVGRALNIALVGAVVTYVMWVLVGTVAWISHLGERARWL